MNTIPVFILVKEISIELESRAFPYTDARLFKTIDEARQALVEEYNTALYKLEDDELGIPVADLCGDVADLIAYDGLSIDSADRVEKYHWIILVKNIEL